jgi:hypothetical protein
MAGQLTIDTLRAGSGVLATQNGMTGIGKAWANFNPSSGTVVLNNSFNVSSVTRNATGDYTVSFTTAMPNANYVMGAVLGNGTSTTDGVAWVVSFQSTTNITTSSCRIITSYGSNAGRGLFDPNPVTVAFFGN